MSSFFHRKTVGVTAVFALALGAASPLQAAVVDVTDGDFSSLDGITTFASDITPGWYEATTAVDYGDYFVDPSTDTGGYAPQFSGTTGAVAFLEVGSPYIYQSIGTAAGEAAVKIDWDHISRNNREARGTVVSIYASATPLATADGSSLSSLGATLVGSVDVTALSLGFSSALGNGNASEIIGATATVSLAGVSSGDSLYVEFTPNGDNSQAAILDNIVVSVVPEPGSLALLGLGGLCLLRRRRF